MQPVQRLVIAGLFLGIASGRAADASGWNGTWSGVTHLWGAVTLQIDLPSFAVLTVQDQEEALHGSYRQAAPVSLELSNEQYRVNLQRSDASSRTAILALSGPGDNSETINVHME